MKHLALVFLGTLAVFALATPVRADLITITSGVQTAVYDTVSGLYWVPSIQSFTGIVVITEVEVSGGAYADATSKVDEFNTDAYFGITNWHLASSPEMETLWSNGEVDIAGHFDSAYLYIPSRLPCNIQPGPGGLPVTVCPPPDYDGWIWNGWYGESNAPGYHSTHRLSYGSVRGAPFDYHSVTYSFPDSYPEVWGGWVVGGTPVPEPSTLTLLGIGIVGLIGYGWRHSRR